MSDYDVLVRAKKDIGIADGKFVALGPNLSGTAAEEIDATNLLVFPGVIDAHVHFNEPGRTHWEGFATGSRAAAAGGTTTFFDMPLNAHPPPIDGASFDLKRAAAEAASLIDFGLWGGLVPENLNELETLKDRGVVGVKAFMCNSGIDDFLQVDTHTLSWGMRTAAGLGLLVAVHAESQEITSRLTAGKLGNGQTTISDYIESRPISAELDAIRRAIDLANETGCRLHIVHVSCRSAIDLVAEARARGVDVTCETCPHYLFLNEDDMRRLGAVAKCAPPLRSLPEQNALWNELGNVATIGSDHSPSPPEMKEGSDFFQVWGGISGCQHLLPLLVDAAGSSNRNLSHEQVMRLTSQNVAERFGIGQKGRIEIGKDADLAILDPNKNEVLAAESLQYRHRQSPYLGRTLHGRVVRTLLRGQTVCRDGKVAARPIGKFIQPQRV